jgi:hypothetical protein
LDHRRGRARFGAWVEAAADDRHPGCRSARARIGERELTRIASQYSGASMHLLRESRRCDLDGRRAMRVCVVNWRTTPAAVDRTVEAVARAIADDSHEARGRRQ